MIKWTQKKTQKLSVFRKENVFEGGVDLRVDLFLVFGYLAVSYTHLYAMIGYGGISISKILPRIKDDYTKLSDSAKQMCIRDRNSPRRTGQTRF